MHDKLVNMTIEGTGMVIFMPKTVISVLYLSFGGGLSWTRTRDLSPQETALNC